MKNVKKGILSMRVFLFFVLILFVVNVLGGCTSATNEGGDTSLQNNITIKNYELSKKTQEEIKENKEKIVITELIDSSGADSYERSAVKTSTFINTVENKMLEEGYTIISSDTNGMGDFGQVIFVTLIFEKVDTVEQLG